MQSRVLGGADVSVYGTPKEFVDRLVGKSYLADNKTGRRFWPVKTNTRIDLRIDDIAAIHEEARKYELIIFNAWLEGACACKTGMKFKDNPRKHDTARWRAWGRGFRAWERDAKHRKTKEGDQP